MFCNSFFGTQIIVCKSDHVSFLQALHVVHFIKKKQAVLSVSSLQVSRFCSCTVGDRVTVYGVGQTSYFIACTNIVL